MKSKKLNLKSLSVKSFVISYNEEESKTLKGGATRGSCGVKCPFGPTTDTMDNDCV